MARGKASGRGAPPPAAADDRSPAITLLGIVLLLTEVIVLPSAASPFREPKMAVAVAGLALVLGVLAAVGLWRHQLEIHTSPLVAALAAYPALLAVSALWAASPRRALLAAGLAGAWVAVIVLLAGLGRSALSRLVVWAAVGAAASVVVELLQVANRSPLVAVATSDDRLARTGLAGNPADLAAASLLLIPLLLTPGERRVPSRFGLALIAVLGIGVALSQTLTGYVAIAALMVAWLVHRRSRKLWLGAVTLLVVLAAAAALSGVGERLRTLDTNLREGNWYAVFSARADGWTAAAQMISDHPLTGVGGANFTQAFYPARLAWLDTHETRGARGELATHFPWTHCDPLQLVAELGVPGTLWLLLFAVSFVRSARDSRELATLAAAAAAPFLLFHYPAHLAIGLIPLALILARLVADGSSPRRVVRGPAAARGLALLVLALTAAVVVWQYQGLATTLWYGRAEQAIETSIRLPEPLRGRTLAGAEKILVAREAAHPEEAPWLLRLIGRTRLALGRDPAAEDAFRRAFALWPHAQAELGLGLALAAEGRVTEALPHLERVARVNPKLVDLIPDPELRRAVSESVRQAQQ